MFLEKGVLKLCSKFTGEHPCRSAISKKLQSNFIEIALQHGCSLVNLLHIFRITTLYFSKKLFNIAGKNISKLLPIMPALLMTLISKIFTLNNILNYYLLLNPLDLVIKKTQYKRVRRKITWNSLVSVITTK